MMMMMTRKMGFSGAVFFVLVVAAAADERAPRSKRQADGCAQPPDPPHTKYTCSDDAFYLTCDAVCDPGYIFQDHSPSPVEHLCDIFGSSWFSGPDVPPCVPICTSPCQNGGTCDAPNHCSCPTGFGGPLCQNREDPCKEPASPQNGRITCRKQGAELVCTVSCFAGFRFQSSPAAAYKCSPDGVWAPAKDSIPNCMQDFDIIPTTPTGTTATHAVGRGAMCVAWGQEHYRTFDNHVYTFTGACTYTLARDCAHNAFTVNVINDRNCQPGAQCKRELDLFLGDDTKVSLRQGSGGPVVTVNGNVQAVPSSRSGTLFQMVGRYLSIQSPLGFMLKWDGKESVFFRVTDEMKHRTCGLCGVYDGDQGNDFTLSGGGLASNAAAFGTSWKKTIAGEAPCADSSQQQSCSADASTSAESRCAALLSDPAFTACHSAVEVNMYVEACKFDCCGHDSDACTCTAMEAYSRACMDRGIAMHWRKNNRCPVQCSGGKLFQECGSPCQLTCDNPDQKCTDTTCVDGCFCPPGTVEDQGRCIPANECPCKYNGNSYNNGASFKKDCNTCTCQSGTISCTQDTCSKRCSAIGDPHYMTFDGKRFDFMGNCSYYLLYDNDFDVIVDNIQCGHGDFPATCTKSVTIDVNGMNIKLDHNHRLFINGREIHQLPYNAPGLKIFMVSSLFMQAELSNGVVVLWDGRTRVYVTAPSAFEGHTQGLCGTWDNNQNNDFMSRQNIVEQYPNVFGNSWKTNSRCHDLPPVLQNPCDLNPQRYQEAKVACAKLKSDIFSKCHSVEPVEDYIKSCEYDMCSCSQNTGDCLCPNLAVYADTCAAQGVKLQWRQVVSECMIQCPGGQEYQVCGNPCERTCRNLVQSECQQSCVEGCNCPDGQALDERGQCIETIQCPCVFDGKEYPAGYVTLKGAEMCQCSGAQWSCSRLTFGDNLPPNLKPLCPNNTVYKDCVNQCPLTCDTLGQTGVTCSQDAAQCQSGCECLEGFVRQGNECVKAAHCPCHHGGKDYYEGDVISMDCNQCTCRSQKWDCETNVCPATCSAVGDSHYTTFDGKQYDFQGACDYVLVKSQAGADPKFQISTENIACGTSGVTCSRQIEVTVGEPGTPAYYKLELVGGQSVVPDSGSPFTVKEVGEFVYITTPFGLTIQWDKGTRVYIKLETQHRGKVEGLCGNFNGDQNDDFKGPSGGPAVVKATEFGDSWRLHDYCAPSLQVVDTCQRVPQRRPWAEQQCSLLASDVFAPCHAVEDHTSYMQRCVYDTCACNQGGDCECLCTAIAAYAHVCANKGFPIKWRTNSFCPLGCDDCETYTPCVSPCPKKTCENRLTYAQQCKDVQNTCFEGCDLQPCPSGQVYASLRDPVVCVPEALCDTPTCKFNGKTYREGERIYDAEVCNHACEICNCRLGKMEHITFGSCQQFVPTEVSPSGSPMKTPPPLNMAQIKTTATMSVCKPGEVYDPCSYQCEEACSPLRRSTPLCKDGVNTCVPGCRNVTAQALCAPGEKRADVNTCVPANMCPCLKPDGSVAKAFETWKNPEDSCSDCSCQSGMALCTNHDPTCTDSGTPSPPPLTNQQLCGWSQWMNLDTPTTGSGDVESLVALRSAYHLCDKPINIQCRDTFLLEEVPSDSDVTCDVATGLTCNNGDHSRCPDYEVRVYCACSDSTTPAPSGTPAKQGICQNRWSDWVNRDDPSATGDQERLSLEELAHFCPGGRITDLQCFTTSDIEYVSTGETVHCSLEDGLTCLNAENSPVACSDYKIRYQCACNSTVINNDENPTPKPKTSQCGWTPWMSGHLPTPAGEVETIASLRTMPEEFCSLEDITAVECRPLGNQIVDDKIKAAVTCDLRYDGMVCRNEDLPKGLTCPDYQVRFLCEPRGKDCSGQPTVSPTRTLVRPGFKTHITGHKTNTPVESTYPACRDNMEEEALLEVPDSQLTASSSLSIYTDSSRSSLDSHHDSLHSGGWVALANDDQQWLQVQFHSPVTVTGVVTKGREGSAEWVTDFVLLYSLDGQMYRYYQEEANLPKTFSANSDANSAVRQKLQPTTAMYFLVKPMAWHGAVAMRLGLLGCRASAVPTAIPTAVPVAKPHVMETPDIPDICTENMGMMTGQIRDAMLIASSYRDNAHAPQKARLGGSGSWFPARDDVNQHLQIDLLTPRYVTGLTTQGRPAAVSFVKTYRILYSVDGVNWNVYREHRGVDKVFSGNTDSMTPVTNMFNQPIRARFVRINPRSWSGRIALRMELHGCFQEYPSGSLTPTAVPTAQPMATPTTHIADECIQWDRWIDTHQPGLESRDDFEPIETVRSASRDCSDPLAIQCRTATSDHTPWEKTGQSVRCDLWTGLLCNADDVDGPACFNYQVRVGCLKQTAECLSKIPTAIPTAEPGATPVPACYPDMDVTSCPATCPSGQLCDGVKCVTRSECPCRLENAVIRARDVTVNSQCETCQCLNGEIRCVPKTCSSCSQGSPQMDRDTCSCECVMCNSDRFQCSTGSCIPQSSRCDGVIDCQNDELDCVNPGKFLPPTAIPTARPGATPKAEPDHHVQVTRTFQPDCPVTCPKAVDIQCPARVPVVEIIGACNCTELACLATPLPGVTLTPQLACHYQQEDGIQHIYQIGDTWKDGDCSECACLTGSDGSGEIACQRQHCDACKPGERMVKVAGKCCGVCEPSGCLLRGKLYKAGDVMPSSLNCYTQTCEIEHQGQYVIREKQRPCPSLRALSPCSDDSQRYDSEGCCLTCIPKTLMGNGTSSVCTSCSPQPMFLHPRHSVAQLTATNAQGVPCRNLHPVTDLTQCSGQCGSSTSFPALREQFQLNCLCCQPTSVQQSHVTLTCDDGTTLEHSYDVPTACQCGQCAK